MSGNSGLSRNQRRAIPALLSHKSIAGAAASLGMSEKTISRYLELPEFRAALFEAETHLIDEASRRLIAGQDAALKALEALIDDAERSSDQRLAAQAWLDFALRYRDFRALDQLEQLAQKVAALEAAYHETKNANQS